MATTSVSLGRARFGRIARATTLLVAVLGAAYALTIFDPGFILGIGPYWSHPFGDHATHMIGARYFAYDAWRFPLFYVPKLSWPEGANIVFTDSLPLLALAAKLVYEATGHWYNYIGAWTFACFPLLAVFTALAARQAGAREGYAQVAAAMLAVAGPAFILRYGHASLMGQFLIAWSVLLYLRLRESPGDRSAYLQFCAVAMLSVTLQAYFLLMVVPFLVAALAQVVIDGRMRLREAALKLGLAGAAVLATGAIAGIIGVGGTPATAWGFGYYSMNVLSPFLPPRAHLPEVIASHVKWNGNGLTWDATGGQMEGYNYVGAGMLLLLVVHLATWRGRGAVAALRRHACLAFVLVGFLVFALSNRIFVGDWLALELPIPRALGSLVGHFRTGGRIFWPIFYVLLVVLVAATVRRFRPGPAKLLLAAAVLLQLADTQFMRSQVSIQTRQGLPEALPEAEWSELLRAHRVLRQYPSMQCGGWADGWPGNNSNMEMLWMAAKLDLTTNSAYLARPNRDCAREKQEGLQFNIGPDELVVYSKSFPQHLLGASAVEDRCRAFDFGIVCSRRWNELPRLAASPAFRAVIPQAAAEVRLGDRLSLAAGGNGLRFLARGWSIPEPWGIWTLGGAADMVLMLPSTAKEDIELVVDGYAFVHPKRLRQQVTVFVNDVAVAEWIYDAGERMKRFSARIPSTLVPASRVLRVRFVPRHVESPKHAGVSEDPREIGMAFADVTLQPAASETFPQQRASEVRLGEKLSLAAGGNGLRFLVRGWSIPEAWGMWTLGAAADMVMLLPPTAKGDLELVVDGYAFVHQRRLRQEVAVLVNDVAVAEWTYDAGERMKRFSARIPARLVPTSRVLRIRFAPRHVESPKHAGVSEDAREIGMAIADVTLQPAP